MAYNPYIHHRRTIRLPGHDYSCCGAYFITICTKNMEPLFGDIIDGIMVLNDAGRVVKNYWLRTPEIRSHVELDEWIIMPNHFHGIIVFNDYVTGVNHDSVIPTPGIWIMSLKI